MEMGEVASGVEAEEWTDQWVSVWQGERLLALGGCRVLAAAGGSFDVDGDQEIGEDREAVGERGERRGMTLPSFLSWRAVVIEAAVEEKLGLLRLDERERLLVSSDGRL